MREYELLAAHAPFSPRFEVEDTRSGVRILALADFAFAVKIPYRLRQGLDYVRCFSFQDIIDMVHGSDIRLSAFESSRDAKQAHQVGIVCMKELAVLTSVDHHATNDPFPEEWHTGHSSDIS